MRNTISLFILILLFGLLTAVTAQSSGSALATSTGGKRVLAYFDAFNSSDEQKLRDFFANNIMAESLKERPVEPRIVFHRRIKSDLQPVQIEKVIANTDGEVRLLAHSQKGGWAQYTFEFGPKPEMKIAGFGVELTEPPSENSNDAIAPVSKAEFTGAAEKYLQGLASSDKFSGVVLVAQGDKPVFLKAYGKANRELGAQNQTDTKFNLGSINKVFTRIAIGQLIQQGKIGFDDKLGKYLPDYPNKAAGEKVTIRQLVNMRSGIGDFFGDKFEATPKTKFRSNSDFIPMFADQPLAFEPGTQERYSNGGYVLLGAIIEKVTGRNYYDYVRENIFKPAGMTNTDSFESDKLPSNTAEGYSDRGENGKLANNSDTRPARGSAAGGGYSTAGDLLKFALALHNGKLSLLGDDGTIEKGASIGIAGGAPGINAFFSTNDRSGFTIAVLSNLSPPSAELVGKQLNSWIRSLKDQ